MTPTIDKLPTIFSLATRREMGERAGLGAASAVRQAISERGAARVMLAAAPSQQETLTAFVHAGGIDWAKVEMFHMDDYIGLPPAAPQGFATWLQRVVVDQVPSVRFHRIPTDAGGEAAAERYEALMGTDPFDVVFVGLGVNGHLAFNDPPARLDDPRAARVVTLDTVCRQQQVDEGHFEALEDVPPTAVTVTIPRLLDAVEIVATVPGRAKRQAVQDTLERPISGDHPGTALRTHPRVSMFLEPESDPR